MAHQDWDERYSGDDFVWHVAPNQFVASHLSKRTPGTAIDLGAGEGRNAVWLAQQGWRVRAVDFSAIGLEKGRTLATQHGVADAIDFVTADALVYEPPELVDLVLLSYLQLPVVERCTVLERAATWLAPGGRLFVIAHDRSNVEEGHGGPSSAEVCYDVSESVAVLHGLDVITAEVVQRSVETDDGPRTALDTLVIADRPR
jgi:ubiquinone/menaquinone biosynthesis C-methylase UbiE